MSDEPHWHVSRDDSEDLGFALSCLITGAITLDEFKGWIYLVLEQSEEFPDFLIDLIDVEPKFDLISGWRDLIGFWPSSNLSPQETKAIVGIAYARFERFRDDTIRRGAALDALRKSAVLRTRFARSFPAIDIPGEAEDREASGSAQDLRVSAWWLSGSESTLGAGVFVPRQRTIHLFDLAVNELRRTTDALAQVFVEAFAGVAPIAAPRRCRLTCPTPRFNSSHARLETMSPRAP